MELPRAGLNLVSAAPSPPHVHSPASPRVAYSGAHAAIGSASRGRVRPGELLPAVADWSRFDQRVGSVLPAAAVAFAPRGGYAHGIRRRPARLAAEASLLSATIVLSGGIIGTLHHLYFAGTPTVALAWGSVFSALEVVPLILVAYPALEDLRMARATP